MAIILVFNQHSLAFASAFFSCGQFPAYALGIKGLLCRETCIKSFLNLT